MNNCYLLGECAFCSPWQRRRLPGLALLILYFQNHGRDPIGWVVFLTAGCNGPVDFVFSKSWSRPEHRSSELRLAGLALLILCFQSHGRDPSGSVVFITTTKGGGVASPQGVLDILRGRNAESPQRWWVL